MATSNIQAQLKLGLDSTTSVFNDTAVKRVPSLHVFEYARPGKRVCMHVHGGLACLHIPLDGKQTVQCCLRKFAASLEHTLNIASQPAKQNIQDISLISCIIADLLLRMAVMNKSFEHHDLHIPCLLQLFADYKLCTVNSVSAAVHRFRAQTEDMENGIKIRIRDTDISASDKSQLKISSSLIPVSESSFCFQALVDHTLHKGNNSSKLLSQEKMAKRQRGVDVLASDNTDEHKLDIKAGLVPSATNKESVYTLMDFLEQAQIIRLAGSDDFIIHSEDDNYSDDDIGLIPQFDGASDKITDSQKKSNTGKIPVTVSQNADCLQVSEDSRSQASGSDLNTAGNQEEPWRIGAAGREPGNSQSYSSGSWAQSWSQPSGSGSGSWHGHSQSWPQQQQLESWPQHLPSAFPPQKAPFRSPSSAPSFQSPPHNPYASANHQQTFQTPSHYHYPPYQSPPTSQSYQSPPHPYQSPRSSQVLHSSQPYSTSSYQSASASQTYHSLGTSNQPYQMPASNKPYPSATGNHPCGSHSTNLPYQSPLTNNSFQQPTNAQTYPSPYQTPHSNQLSHQQPYHSPAHDVNQAPWSTQNYSAFKQSHFSSQSGPQSTPEQHLGESPQPGTLYGQPVNPVSEGQETFFPSQGLHQQVSLAKSTGSSDMSVQKAQSNQFGVSQIRQKRAYKKRNKGASKLKSSESPAMSPTSVVVKSSMESKSSSISTPPFVSETGYFQLQNDIKYPLGNTGDKESVTNSGNTSPHTKIPTFEFKPDISFSSLSSEPSTSKCMELLNSPSRIKTEKSDKITTTPMIQQLLMEEPIRMNIKKEDRDAVMKKPMASPTLPKPKRKYKARVKQSVKVPKRPRSTSLSSPVPPPIVGYCGYSPQPIMNPHNIGRPGRSHSISLPFSCETNMPSPIHNYGWPQWRQHSLPPSNEWQEQQKHWGINERHNFDSSRELSCSPAEMNKPEMMTHKLQHTSSVSLNDVQSSVCSQNLQPSQSSQFHSQNAFQNSLQISYDSGHTYSSRENAGDKSSLSSLLQLISDVGSDDTGWENESVSIPNIFSNSSDLESPNILTSVTESSQESPSAKDFITLEAPCKQGYQKTYSDTIDITSSEEFDRMDFDLANDLKNHSLGSIHPRVGKQNRLKKLGILQTRTKLSSASYLMDSNPSYTYTFHVPTTLFKKLKFFRNAESRKHFVNVVRMHPMDARRYSLMKIGREIVHVTKLTDSDLANYNVTLPPVNVTPADGCTNRVNLDIPILRADKQLDDNGEKMFSNFDTDFPPNKVAPPSSFCASQMSLPVARTSSATSSRSPVGPSQMQQYTVQRPANYNGGISPVPQQTYSSQEENLYCAQQDGLQQVSQDHISRHSDSQQRENSSGILFHQFNQKTNSSYSHETSLSTEDNGYSNQQNVYIDPEQQYQQHQNQQQQAGSGGFHPQPKNGLRSLGQHGLTSSIESGSADDFSGDQEVKDYSSTTKSSLFNTRVNAHLWDNHAEHMDIWADAQLTNQQQFNEHDKHIKHRDIAYHMDKEEVDYNEKQKNIWLSGASLCHYSQAEDNASALQKSDHEHNEVTDSECTLNHSDGDEAQRPKEMTKLETHRTNTSLNLLPDKSRGSLCWRKNRKSLSLTIPKYSDLNLLHMEGVQSSSDDMERGHSSNFQKESDEDNFIDSIDASAIRRSTRSTVEGVKSTVDVKHSTRQAKLRSVYSSSNNLKPKKRRKRQGPLIEGVHYIVIGKFKGHQSMQVRINKLNMKPTEVFMTDYFEELAAKDIVRLISPVSCPKNNMMDGESEHNNYCKNIGESKSIITEMCDPPYYCNGNNEFDQNANFGSRSAQRMSSLRSVQHTKFRSAKQHAKYRLEKQCAMFESFQHRDVLQEKSQTSSPTNKIESKNVMAGPLGASKNNDHNNSVHFVEDKFFGKFKESFIRHCRLKEHVNLEPKEHENTFFEGIRRCSFQNFQESVISNVQKLMSAGYSSSSDDEDDVLDSTILKKIIDTTQKSEVSQLASEVTLNKLVKQGHAVGRTNQAVLDCAFSNHDDENESRFRLGSPEASKNTEIERIGRREHEGTFCNDIPCRSLEWENRSQEKADNRRQFLKAYNYDNFEVGSVSMLRNTKYSILGGRMHGTENPIMCSITESNTLKNDRDDKEDYLKCQMAFFEDISSDSDTNDTVIIDSYKEKKNMFQVYTSLPFTISDHLAKETTKVEQLQNNNHIAVLNIRESCSSELNGILHCDSRHDCAELSQINESNYKPNASINVGVDRIQILDKGPTQLSDAPVSEFYKKSSAIFKLTDQQEDASYVSVNNLLLADDFSPISEVETAELDISVSVPTIKSTKCDSICPVVSKVTENEIIDKPINSEHNTEASISTDTTHRQTRRGKRVKKSVRDKKSKLHKRRQSMMDGQYSCTNERRVAEEIDVSGLNRSHKQRKRTCYAYQTEVLDSPYSSDSGDENLSTSISQHASSKSNSKSRVTCSKEHIRNEMSVSTGRGSRGRSARGRRKRQAGGEKLLNSLSILHMATLANLIETQSEPGDDQLSETITQAENENTSCQYSDNLNHDCNTTTSTQDQPFVMLPKNSLDMRRHTRRRCAKEDKLPAKLLHFSQNVSNFKAECIGISNTGSKPPAFNKIVSNSSSSPVPSNFTFNHSSNSNQPEAANPTEDAGTYNTLQLLETRRAQVNCASFSMKDILKLTTPDNSMDSDSKNNAQLARLSEPQGAQIKHKALCINDIFKLSSADANSEAENVHESCAMSLLSNQPFHCDQESHPRTLQILPQATASCDVLSQTSDSTSCQVKDETMKASDNLTLLAKFKSPSSRPCIETTETSWSLLSHSANIGTSLPEKYAEMAFVQAFSLNGLMSNHETEKETSVKSDSLPVNDVEVNTINCSVISDCKVNNVQYSSNAKNKHLSEFSQYINPPVTETQEFHHRTDISKKPLTTTSCARSPGPSYSPKIKSLSEPQSPVPSCNLITETLICASSNLSQKYIIGGLDGSLTPTTGTIVQTAGAKNTSMSCVEESEKPHCDSHSTIPSQVPLQSNVPETPVSADIEIISKTPDEKFINEKFTCSISRPQSMIPKQENKGNHKNMKVRNVYRGVKPLHSLQISSYSYVDPDLNSQHEQGLHNSRNSHYPYCWQWPAYTPGSDPAVSPLNLCTTKKSPNNYSPITPTSPISPNYPTQAQGATESDLSSPFTTGKSLWYPWLKVDAADPGINVDRSDYQPRHHKICLEASRSSVTPLNKDQSSDNLCSDEVVVMEPCKLKNDTRFSELKNNSSGRFRGQFSLTRPTSLKLGGTSNSGTVFKLSETFYKQVSESLPSTSCTVEASRVVPEESSIATFDAKENPSKTGVQRNVSDSAYWSTDTSETPDSLDSCQSNSSSSKSCVSHADENVQITVEASDDSSICGNEQGERFKYEKKSRGKLKMSLVNQSSTQPFYDSEQSSLKSFVETKHNQKNTDTSGSRKSPVLIQKRSTKVLNQSLHTRDYKRRKYLNIDNCASDVKLTGNKFS